MTLSPVVTQLLRTASPTLLSALALPPPLNVLAAGVVSSALGRFSAASGDTPLQPEQVARVIEEHSGDPTMVQALQQAEADLQRYEDANHFRFAQLDARDRENARAMHVASGISDRIFEGGIRIVWVAVIGMLVMIAALLAAITGRLSITAGNTDLAIAAFGLIGTAVGFVNGLAATVVAFYWGSSQGSKEKTLTINESIAKLTDDVSQVALRQPSPPPPPTPPTAEAPPAEPEPAETTAAAPEVIVQAVRRLATQHRHVPDSVTWALTAEGISVEGAAPVGTSGDPTTVTAIWKSFGPHCVAAASRFTVPVELIVATIAAESDGKPNAFRQEKNDASYGLMQTLLGTAREALGDKQLTGQALFDPETSILAGTAYIARQRDKHNFDPVLVAAAYNAGSPRPAPHKGNRWRLWCHPPESGAHLDRFVARFNDAMAVSKAQDWGAGGTPSFVTAFIEAAPATAGTTGTLTTPAASARTSEAAAAALHAVTAPIPVVRIAAQKELAIAIQQKLTEHGYLDPPPDGEFQTVSLWAIDRFCTRNELPTETFGPDTARMLLEPRAPLALPRWKNSWIDRVVDHMGRMNYWYSRFPGCRNIVYLEGANPDGTLNKDEADKFNDLRLVFWFDDEGNIEHKQWEATTEPGDFYTMNPLNPAGAARIKFGQYKAWRVGMHKNDHESLTQAADVSVFRDFDKDRKRTGDKLDTGSFGLNQHHGSDASRESIGKTSAGCLVGRTIKGHQEFMEIVKQDPRYVSNRAYKFVTTILDAGEVLRT